MLTLFARLRGVRSTAIQDEVNRWLDEVGITQYADRQCGTYSGGNKRKLNVAQALVGEPPIIFMDEPTSGVDPASRRKLWSIIR
jgi:ATP-binding cassette subfamily A (ABC1) protein 3